MAWPKGVSREEYNRMKASPNTAAMAGTPDAAPATEPVPQPQVMQPPPVVPQVLQQYPDLDPEAPPPNLFSGTTRKLEVFGKPGTDPKEPIPGHQLYWFHDEQNGMVIQQAIQSGWRFVEKEEIALNDAPTSPGNSDTGNHVRRWVGHGADQGPVYAYLMKKPNWLYDRHMQDRERVHDQQDMQLSQGTYKVDDLMHTYTAGRAPGAQPGIQTGLPGIKMGRYYRPPST